MPGVPNKRPGQSRASCHLTQLADLLDSEPMEIEISQPVFSLQIARVAQAGLADVDRRHPSIGLAQRMDRRLRRSTAGDQDLPACLRLLCRPQEQGQRPPPIRVAIEVAMSHPPESRALLLSSLPEACALFVPLASRQVRGTRICHSSIERSRNRTERRPGRPDRRPSIRFGRVTCG